MWTRENPSPAYTAALEEAREFHRTSKAYDGTRTFKALSNLEALCREHTPRTLLDYGCGKGKQYESIVHTENGGLVKGRPAVPLGELLGVDSITPYDPAVPAFEVRPPDGTKFDGVFCVDVMSVIPAEDAPWVIADMAAFASKFLFVKFRLGGAREKKLSFKVDYPFANWLEVFDHNTPATLDVLVVIKICPGKLAICRRRPHEEGLRVVIWNKPHG